MDVRPHGPRARTNQARRVVRLVLIGVLSTLGITLILLFPILPLDPPLELTLGTIAPEDIRAPRQITYVSLRETEAARQAAVAAVADIYDPPNASIGRQQVRKARQTMSFIRDVRADPFASPDLKQRYLSQITTINLTDELANALLTIPDSQFEQVEREVIGLVEEAMSGPVREGREAEVRSQLELKVSTDLPDNLIPLTVSIARQLVVSNSRFNSEATEQAREAARAAVREVEYTFQPGQIVIRAGQQIDEHDLEALAALGLEPDSVTWPDIASAFLISLLSTIVLAVYLASFKPTWLDEPGHVLLIAVLLLFFLLAGQIMLGAGEKIAYLFPAAALGLTLAALFGLEIATIVILVLASLLGYMWEGSLEIALFAGLGSLLAAGSLRKTTRLHGFFRAGVFAALTGAAVLLIFRLPGYGLAPLELAQLLLLAVLNGMLSAGITLVILFVIGSLTGWVTSLQLVDLMRPDHPLQHLLQNEALGTYQHTLSVANLVEAAAEAIGADSLLARVGALYHDIGKASNPAFFTENRVEGGANPHDTLPPLTSARIIKAHVSDGIEMAHKHRLPPRIIDFIAEHHGTTPVAYFLNLAREQAAESGVTLNELPFYYEGPKPRSRETAILMLADGCESAVRANRPVSSEEMEKIVNRIFQQRIDQHQLDESGLSLGEIKTIRETFVRTLKGMYHPRVKYPEQPPPDPDESTSERELIGSSDGPTVVPEPVQGKES